MEYKGFTILRRCTWFEVVIGGGVYYHAESLADARAQVDEELERRARRKKVAEMFGNMERCA